MKKVALFILFLVATLPVWFTGCEGLDEHYSTNPNYRLAFSVDTLSFDTVFTTIGSATKQFLIYNRNNEALNIQSIMLASGGESGFRLNVDGRKGDYFDNVGILAEDSMFVFVEVTVDPNDSNQPLLVEDSVVFITNGQTQSVLLEAYGQNMHLYKGGLHITRDTTLSADLPHLIYDSLTIENGATLRLSEGTTLYMHDKANIIVSGQLISEGTLENPVTIRGDRLDDVLDEILPYDRTPGQWGGIYFTGESFGNRMEYTIVRNGTTGITLEPSDPTKEKLSVSNCQFTNMQGNVFTSSNNKATVVNTEISNAGGAVVALACGEYQFTHCTLVNYMRLIQRELACLALTDTYYPTGSEEVEQALLKVRFDNCLIDGSNGSGNGTMGGEIAVSFTDESTADYYFNHCAIATKVDEDARFNEVILRTDDVLPYYKMTGGEANKYRFDFRPDSVISIGVGKADPVISAQYPMDRLGVDRLNNGTGPTIGAYEFVQD